MYLIMGSVKKPNTLKKQLQSFVPAVFMSAKYDTQLTEFNLAIEKLLEQFKKTQTFFVPIYRMDIINLFHKFGQVEDIKFEEKITVTVTINEILAKKILASLYNKNN